MDDSVLTFSQALQLVGIGPSLFLVAFLALTLKHPAQVVIPILFFLALACSFAQPLIPLLSKEFATVTRASITFGESLIPALSFLLILQMLMGRIPPALYWLILAVPLVGGGSITYIALTTTDDVCLTGVMCISPLTLKMLYHVFGTSLIFLLLIMLFARQSTEINSHQTQKKHQYWLIISLIMLSLVLLALDLADLSERITMQEHLLLSTVVRITYIYLVITSIFRVFDRQFEIDEARIPSAKSYVITSGDETLAEKIRELMRNDRLYREMVFSREKLATILTVSEHQLSKVINRVFGKNFNRFVNNFRIEEAKERLAAESTSITVIAFEVGFNSIASFNRVFKDECGVSPTEYRESAQKNKILPAKI
jgi:AraC-like DNA-binding protein